MQNHPRPALWAESAVGINHFNTPDVGTFIETLDIVVMQQTARRIARRLSNFCERSIFKIMTVELIDPAHTIGNATKNAVRTDEKYNRVLDELLTGGGGRKGLMPLVYWSSTAMYGALAWRRRRGM